VICYAARTGTRSTLAKLRAAGWRLLISRTGKWSTYGFPYGIDNGAWTDHQQGRSFDDARFRLLIDKLGEQADFVVAPDIVEGGVLSLRLSLCWLPQLLIRTRLVLVPVQNGMVPADLANVVLPKRIGLFLGGSTAWKLETMAQWGEFCARRGVHYHVGRVNTQKRFRLAHAAGADSVDGSAVSRFSKELPALDFAARQWDMWSPPKNRDEQLAWASSPSEVHGPDEVAA
jgi:hypothetical protein